MTAREIAQRVEVVETTIYRPARRRGLPDSKVGGTWRLERRDVGSWIEERKQPRGGSRRGRAAPPDGLVARPREAILSAAAVPDGSVARLREAILSADVDGARDPIDQVATHEPWLAQELSGQLANFSYAESLTGPEHERSRGE